MPTMKTTSGFLRKQIAYHKKRIRDPINFAIYQQNSQEITQLVDDPTLSTLVQASIPLNGLASWFSSKGLSAISEGDSNGWYDIHRACCYQALSVEIQIDRSISKRPTDSKANLTNYHRVFTLPYINGISRSLSYFSLQSSTTSFEKLGNYLLSSLKEAQFPRTLSLAYFSAWLYEQSHKAILTAEAERFGVYSQAIEGWLDPAALQHAVLSMCEYHVQRIKASPNDLTDFETGPYDLIPFEILFMFKIRRSQGLEDVHVSHPLLESDFAKLPSVPFVEDQVSSKIVGFLSAQSS